MTDEQKNAYRTAAAEKYRALDGLKIKSKGMSIEERTATQVKIDAEFEQKVKAILSKEQLEMLNKKTAN